MLLNIISMVILASLSAYMFACARFECTRRIAIIPGIMSLMEMTMAGVLSNTAFPLITAFLLLCKVAIVAIGIVAIRADRTMAQKRSERRRALKRKLAFAQNPIHMLPPVQSVADSAECA